MNEMYKDEVLKFVLPIWGLLFKKYSVSLVSAPRVGKNIRISYFIDNLNKMGKLTDENTKNLNNSFYVWIDLVNGVNSVERNLRKNLNDILTSAFGDNINLNGRETIIELVRLLSGKIGQGAKIIFIINDANLLYQEYIDFSLDLYRINRKFPNTIQFLFLFSEEMLPDSEIMSVIPQLGYLMLGKVIYFPLLSESKLLGLLNLRLEDIDLKLDENSKLLILKLSGGYPALMMILLRIIAVDGTIPTSNDLIKNNEVLNLFYSIWNSFSEKTQKEAREGSYLSNNFLISTGLVDSQGKWFSELFREYIENIDLHFSTLKDEVFISQMTYSQKLIWDILKSNQNNIVTKEQIATVLWGDLWTDKYSEWTIEKQISNIRRKLPLKYELKSVYGKGYMLTESLKGKVKG
ncbi:MAG TPA: helix-turn-helix domain-containing protein [Candidatus Dojkabacteria bacterium]|nr:helix-turn-helix domain-containing protein [Candidatus Dojkabacteria bacterium]